MNRASFRLVYDSRVRRIVKFLGVWNRGVTTVDAMSARITHINHFWRIGQYEYSQIEKSNDITC